MPRFTALRYEQILEQMIGKIVTRTGLSDISDASGVKHVLAAAARQDDRIYYQLSLLLNQFSIDYASGNQLDDRAKEIQPGLIERKAATKSTGNLRFSRTGTTGTVTIPVGTEVKTEDGEAVKTTVAGSITNGNTESGLVAATATVAGLSGNVASGTLIKFGTKPTGVDSVTNPTPFANGTDKESDDAFRNRIRAYIRSLPRSTLEAIETGVLGATDTDTGATILYSKGVEDQVNLGRATIYIDDGTGSAESSATATSEILTAGLGPGDTAVGGEEMLFLNNKPIKTTATFTLTSSTRGVLTGGFEYSASYAFWVNPASGQVNFSPALAAGEQIVANTYGYFTGLIALAQKIIDGDANDRTNYPGLRAAGTLILAETPTNSVQTVNVTTIISEGFDPVTVRANVVEAIKEYINSLGISGDVLISQLYRKIASVTGVYNATITAPTSDVILLDNQLPRIEDGNISVI